MRHDRRQKNAVLLTIDLTQAVADEAIDRQVSVVIAYRTYDILCRACRYHLDLSLTTSLRGFS